MLAFVRMLKRYRFCILVLEIPFTEKSHKIHPGMTRAEVVKLFGQEPKDKQVWVYDKIHMENCWWVSDKKEIISMHLEDGRVKGSPWAINFVPEETGIEWIDYIRDFARYEDFNSLALDFLDFLTVEAFVLAWYLAGAFRSA
jgi:hypothetical protein